LKVFSLCVYEMARRIAFQILTRCVEAGPSSLRGWCGVCKRSSSLTMGIIDCHRKLGSGVLLLLLFSGLFALPTPQFSPEQHSSSRIIGGKPVSGAVYPWFAALSVSGHVICGGSLVSPRHILTAAHCVHAMCVVLLVFLYG